MLHFKYRLEDYQLKIILQANIEFCLKVEIFHFTFRKTLRLKHGCLFLESGFMNFLYSGKSDVSNFAR